MAYTPLDVQQEKRRAYHIPFGRQQEFFSGDWKIVMIDKRDAPPFEDIKVPVRFKLFSLWSAVMFFYIYGDYFELYQPGKLQPLIAGRTPLGAVSQGVLLGMSATATFKCFAPL
jgi:hypothetical protein